MKVCFVIEGMYNSGGMERVLTVIANALCDNIDISIVTLKQTCKPYYYPISDSVHIYDLDVKDLSQKNGVKKSLSNFLKSNHFDIVVSLGGLELSFLYSIKDGSKKIVWFHFAIDIAKTTWVGPNPSFAARMKAQLQTWKRIFYARKYDRIVVISKADLVKWMRYTSKARLIYNPVTIVKPKLSDKREKAVISVGRLDYQKGFDYLIEAWRIVSKKHPDWCLDIFGEGTLREQLQAQIGTEGLTSCIKLCGQSQQITDEYARHSIYVMSSRAEGLGLVLLEAALCGLPLISFDCPSGPSEIISDGKNGYLVKKVGDVNGLAERICKLIENEAQRKQMGDNAAQMVQAFSVDSIRQQWIATLKYYE